jgi:hypothetical protein
LQGMSSTHLGSKDEKLPAAVKMSYKFK